MTDVSAYCEKELIDASSTKYGLLLQFTKTNIMDCHYALLTFHHFSLCKDAMRHIKAGKKVVYHYVKDLNVHFHFTLFSPCIYNIKKCVVYTEYDCSQNKLLQHFWRKISSSLC